VPQSNHDRLTAPGAGQRRPGAVADRPGGGPPHPPNSPWACGPSPIRSPRLARPA